MYKKQGIKVHGELNLLFFDGGMLNNFYAVVPKCLFFTGIYFLYVESF